MRRPSRARPTRRASWGWAGGGGAAPAGGGERCGLWHPPRTAPRQRPRRGARGAAGGGTRAWPVPLAGRRRRPHRALRGAAGAAHPGRRARLARPPAARAALAAARGRRGGEGAPDRRARRLPTPRPPPAGHRGAGSPAALGTGAPRRQLRDPLARRPAPGHRALPPGARPPPPRLAEHPPGRVAIGGLVVTRQHPMTAKGTVFLAVEDETGMVNVTLWPDAWARLRGVVRRHALLYIEGTLQRETNVVNLVARRILPLPELARGVGGPSRPEGVRQLGHAAMRRLA